MANAEIIAVGSELLTPERVDTNSLALTEQLNAIGIEVVGKQVIGDNIVRLTEAFHTSLARSEIVISCGGLGPTEDDVTREAAAAALGRSLLPSAEQESILIRRFKQIGRPMAPNNLRQIYLIDGAEALPNPNGSAPGQFFRTNRGALALLPGPPRELTPMMADQVIPRLKCFLPLQIIKTRSFRIAGMGESDLDSLIAPIYTKYKNPSTTILFAAGDLFVHLRARCHTEHEAARLLAEVGDPIAELLGNHIYTENVSETLEAVLAKLLIEHNATIATAESCTGGLIASRLTDIPGSSNYFLAGYVTYNEEQKQQILGVSPELLERFSAVSEPVARAMAEGARRRTQSTYAISTTGYAGPSGGTAQDPPGTVYIGIAGPNQTIVKRVHHFGDRQRVRTYSTYSALNLFRLSLLESANGTPTAR